MGWGMEGPDGWEDGRRLNLESIPKGGNAGAEDEEDSTGERGKRCVCVSVLQIIPPSWHCVREKMCARAEEVDAQVTCPRL